VDKIYSIRNFIIGLLVLAAVVQILYLDSYIYSSEKENIKQSIMHDVKNISVSLQGDIEYLMRYEHEAQVKVKLAELGINKNIKHAVLIDKNNIVRASTQLAQIGLKLWEVLQNFKSSDVERIKSNISLGKNKSEGEIWINDNERVIVSVLPVAAFSGSDNIRKDRSGMLIIVYELAAEFDSAFGLLFRLSISQLIGLVVLGGLLQVLVFRRLNVITNAVKKIGEGNYDINIQVAGKDELGRLARGVESMGHEVASGMQSKSEQQQHINKLLGAVTRSEETFKKAQEIAHIGSWDWDISDGSLTWSDEIYRIFGLKPQEFGATYEAFLNSVHPDDQTIVTDAVNLAVSDPSALYFAEHRVVHPDGVVRDVQEQGKVYRDQKGNPVRMIGTVLDITESKRIGQELNKEKNFINAVLDSAAAIILVLNREGQIVRFNYACEKISGYTFEEIKNKFPWETVLPKEVSDEIYCNAFRDLVSSPEHKIGYYINEWVNKSGERFLIDWANSTLLDDNGEVEYVVSIGVDITEKYKAQNELEIYKDNLENIVDVRTKELESVQQELIKKERLATLGQLTATVSHELRNPLGAMAPSLYVVKKLSAKDDERMQQAIERIERNIGRCDRIIDELLDFTRIDKLALTPVLIDLWLDGVINEQNILPGVSIQREFGLEKIQVMLDVDVMRRAVINVFDNACQSMQDESDGNKVIKDAVLNISTKINRNRVELVFSDSGCGMSDEVLQKIFEPLFSTKGFGVGLGMPTVMQIMQQHNGGVDIHSSVNTGSVVILWLPLVK